MSKVWQTCHVLPCLHWHQIFLSIHQAVILSLKSLVGMGPVSLRRQIILSAMSCVLVRNSHLKFSNVVTNGSRRGGYQHKPSKTKITDEERLRWIDPCWKNDHRQWQRFSLSTNRKFPRGRCLYKMCVHPLYNQLSSDDGLASECNSQWASRAASKYPE